MKLEKAIKRDKARLKKKNGMRVTGKSVFVIQQTVINRADKVQPKTKSDNI